ncbi:cysteate synthase [Methanoregula sp.]|uniref:cysteate synthase n=1 Tax=Methanoregula sp. TaxID=2052170 RepID=UPI002C22DCE4|nr:cysteate synthase [Methanoregula sp.]HVP97123.1 cysteate synthase [Methanoregula sp.]
MIPKYRIRCVGGGEPVSDMTSLSCPAGHNSLLRTEYSSRRLKLAPHSGIFRYLCWLPVTHPLLPSGGPVTFTNKDLSQEMGLSHLSISFSGYSPEHHATLTTGSFKELEALPTLERLWELGKKIPVIASAGNTGRAFAGLSAQYKKPVVVVVPRDAVPRLWTTTPAQDVFLVAVDGDYTDAITVSAALAAVPGCVPEGGAKNVARRDGMGTVMLDAAVTLGRIPDHYFQAVGSGTGAIAAWEAAIRLIMDGRYGTNLPRLHLAQNKPFTPLVSAWQQRRRTIDPEIDMPDASNAIQAVMSPVLTNRSPPYGIAGGLFDALCATDGRMYGVSNEEGKTAMQLIRDTTGIDADPAAAVATAALMRATETGAVGPDDHILLNITGGGCERIREDYTLYPLEVSAMVAAGEPLDETGAELRRWVEQYG